MTQRVFVDTNCFLHLRDLKDLPWRDSFPGVEVIEIYVAAVVVDELDRLKTEKTGRTRDRCRAALKQIEQASEKTDMRLQIRACNPGIWLVVAQDPRIDWSQFPQLDPQRADDQLVASALSEAGEGLTTLLSHDTGPLIRARRIGLAAARAPESWMLPAQLDPLEKENAKLQRELAAATSTRPALKVHWLDQDEAEVVRLIIPQLSPLSQEVQHRLLERLQEDYPKERVKVTDSGIFGVQGGFGRVSDYDANRYHSEYSRFLSDAKRQFAQLHTLLEAALNFGEVRFEIENYSQITVESLRVEINARSQAILFGSRADMAAVGGALTKLEPPEPPRDYPMLSPHLYNTYQEVRDPTKFYWLDRPKAELTGVMTCEEFRPARTKASAVYVFTKEGQGELEVEVHGKNLAAPISIRTKIILEAGEADWNHPAVLARVPDWMVEVISSED